MAEIIQFKPLVEKDAEFNLFAFIDLCKHKLRAFGADLAFDDFVWDVTDYVNAKAKSNRIRIYFSSWETVNDRQPESMPEPFVSFAKAYIRYQHAYRPVIDQSARIVPMRAICFALQEIGQISPAYIDSHILNRAAQLIKENSSSGRAYRLGQHLQLISAFIDENRINRIPSRWLNSISRPGDTNRVGKEFEDRRHERLPSPDQLNAVAEAYRRAKKSEDVILSSIVAIMCATPDRVAEILTLPFDCEHVDRLPDGKEVYGLRYWPSKGAAPMIKWVIPSMVDLLKDAISRIKFHTQSARELACWYEKNPTELYLPGHLEAYRGSTLLMQQVSEIVYAGPDYEEEAANLLKWHGLCPRTKIPVKELSVDFFLLEEFILSSLPRNFPLADGKNGLKYSETLCIVHAHAFNQQRRTINCFIESISHGQVGNGLGAGEQHGKSSIFSRLGITDTSGGSIKINTHKFRHYLNTLAMHGGLDELDIAKWSGRKDVRQNRAYDHVSAKDKLALIREAVGDQSKMFGPLGWAPAVPTITRDEFANLKISSAHTTELGYCTHNYTATPCQLHLDCLNCNELVCIKGDEIREANIRKQRDEVRELLQNARKAHVEGAYGANRWVEHQTKTLQRLDELCAIFDDPKVKSGAVIQLKHLPTVSRLVQAAQNLGMDLSTSEDLKQREELLPTQVSK